MRSRARRRNARPEAASPLLLRRIRAAWPLLLLLAASCDGGAPRTDSSPEPLCPGCNVVLISLDTLRADRLGFAGYERDTSPNIDEFAQRSVVFTDVLTQFTSTRWSFRALFAGRYPFRLQHELEESPTLAEIMRSNGYSTAGFSAGGYVGRAWGSDRGFETFHERRGLFGLKENVPLALEWLVTKREDPFFLFIHSYDVHCPYKVPEPHQSMFDEGFVPTRRLDRCDPMKVHGELSAAEIQWISNAYDGGIHYADSFVGPFLSLVEKLDLPNRTVFILTSDHGESLGERETIGHGHDHLFQETARVPLVVHVPGVAPGVVDTPGQLIDLLPTILDLVGIAPPPGARFDGVSLVPALQGERPFEGGRPRLTEVRWDKGYSRDDRWRFIVRGRTKTLELYDLESDPGQLHDVAEDHPELVSELSAELSALLGTSWRESSEIEEEDVLPTDRILEAQLRALGYLD